MPLTFADALTLAIAGYAAVVATGALALEIRRWIESGPRLRLSIIPVAKRFGTAIPDENEYLTARVTNVGTQPTTVTNFGLLEFRSILHRWLQRPYRAAIVPNPSVGYGQQLPYVLAPGTEWLGSGHYDDDLKAWASSRRLFVAIYTSHRARAMLRKVRLPKEKPARSD